MLGLYAAGRAQPRWVSLGRVRRVKTQLRACPDGPVPVPAPFTSFLGLPPRGRRAPPGSLSVRYGVDAGHRPGRPPRCPRETANAGCCCRAAGGDQPDGLLVHGPAHGAHHGPRPGVGHGQLRSPGVPGHRRLGLPDRPGPARQHLAPPPRTPSPSPPSATRSRRHAGAPSRSGHVPGPVSRPGGGAQIVFGNLEGTLTTATAEVRPERRLGQTATRSAIRQLTYATSGRRVHDPEHRQQPLHGLRRAGRPRRSGAPRRRPRPDRPSRPDHVVPAHGVPVAFVGFAPYPYTASLLDLPRPGALVRRRQGSPPW